MHALMIKCGIVHAAMCSWSSPQLHAPSKFQVSSKLFRGEDAKTVKRLVAPTPSCAHHGRNRGRR